MSVGGRLPAEHQGQARAGPVRRSGRPLARLHPEGLLAALRHRRGSAPFPGRSTTRRRSSPAARTRFRLLGFDGRFLQVGLASTSPTAWPGRSRRDSNPVSVANVGLERGPFFPPGHRLGPRVLFDPGDNEHPGHHPAARLRPGPGLLVPPKRHRVGLMVRDNLNFRFNRAALQAD
ncbi:MAG: hypothetical protein MZU84_05890 [Sphingobacterium sp.]|nr:hypothetical protein [Sphingobacterium sp.]